MASRVDVVHLHPGVGVVAPGDTAFAAGLSEEHLSLFLGEEPELGNLVWFFDRVNTADELPDDLSGVIGVTAGTSASEELVESVINRLAPAGGVSEVKITEEDEYFPPPRNLRELLTAIDAAAALSLGAQRPSAPPSGDRQLGASKVLRLLG